MSNFTYVLSFNPLMPNLTSSQIHVFIERNRDIRSWYLAFGGTYLIKSDLVLAHLVEPFRQFFGDNPFILTYAAPNLISGLLPTTVWNWVANVSPPALGSN